MDLFALYMLLNGSGGSGGGANYTAIIEKLNEQFGLEFTTETPIEEVIAAIAGIDTFEYEDWQDYEYEDWTTEEGGEE